jgi:hypothetical protein
MPERDVQEFPNSLHETCEARDTGRLVVALKEIVPDYSPSTHLLKRAINARKDVVGAASDSSRIIHPAKTPSTTDRAANIAVA